MMVLSLRSLVSTVWLSAAHAADSRWHRYIRQVLKNPENVHCFSRYGSEDKGGSVLSSSCPISPIVPVDLCPLNGVGTTVPGMVPVSGHCERGV